MRPRLAFGLAISAIVLAACSATTQERANDHGSATTSSSLPLTRTLPSTTVVARAQVDVSRTIVASLESSGHARTYRLHVPASSTLRKAAPLVIVLHGASGNAARVEFRYHWDALSDRWGFVVVYPQGEGDRWNVSMDPRAVDDVRFLSDLIDHLERQLRVDPRRVFVTGMSNGGAMTYRIGCMLSDRVTAIAPVEAWNPGCRARMPLSMIAIHGLADHEVSFATGQQSVAAWAADTDCPRNAQVKITGFVSHSVWAPCASGVVVELYAVAGSGHEWPGSSPPLPGHDPPSANLDATQVIWNDFRTLTR